MFLRRLSGETELKTTIFAFLCIFEKYYHNSTLCLPEYQKKTMIFLTYIFFLTLKIHEGSEGHD